VGGDVGEPSTAVRQDALVRLTWAAEPQHIPPLRAEVRGWLSPLGFSSETVDDIVLAVNEAATNAVDHAYAAPGAENTFEVSLWLEDGALHVEIADHGRWRLREVAPSGRGFGIMIMKELIDSVVVDHGPSGTSVLLRHPLPTGVTQHPTTISGNPTTGVAALPTVERMETAPVIQALEDL
jgi:anti-sigma regulatory factor (Ser/Thr protein kinase)